MASPGCDHADIPIAIPTRGGREGAWKWWGAVPPDPASSPCHIQHLSWFTWIFNYSNVLEQCKLMFMRAWEMLMQTNLLEGKFKHMPACLHRALAIWGWISPDNYRMSQQFVWATIASGKHQQFHSYAIFVSCWNIVLIVRLIWVLIFILSIF